MRRLHAHLSILVVLTGCVPTVVAGFLLWRSDLTPPIRNLLIVGLLVVWLGLAYFVRSRTAYHLRTLSNLLAALREGDYSFRAREVSRSDPFAEVITELNLLATTLRQQRVEDLEATSLVRKVMAEIDVAVLAFDGSGRLRQVNPTGEALFQGHDDLIGKSAEELGLAECLVGSPARTVELEIGDSRGRWEMRRGTFRQHGRPNQLLVLSDVSRALHAEELAAWKRLIRVIGHELNNSLAPITSLAGSLEKLLDTDPLPEDWRSDLGRGFDVISSRVEALNRFMGDCSRLAKLPEPTIAPIDIDACITRAAALEDRTPITVQAGPEVSVEADQAQIEQVVINLIRNAAEASLDSDHEVEVGWGADCDELILFVRDRGRGLPDSANLFVPFFTTKSDGSGIGLFLSRQIAEAHGGSVSVSNRVPGPGCEAVLRLPLERNTPPR